MACLFVGGTTFTLPGVNDQISRWTFLSAAQKLESPKGVKLKMQPMLASLFIDFQHTEFAVFFGNGWKYDSMTKKNAFFGSLSSASKEEPG